MTSFTIYIFFIIGIIISWIIFYYVVKAAVKMELEKLFPTKYCKLILEIASPKNRQIQNKLNYSTDTTKEK